MKKSAPVHIKNYCVVDNADKIYKHLVKEYEDENHFVHKVKCSCCNTKFEVYIDEHPTVMIKCAECNKEIIVYDLDYYPAAIKLDDKLQMKQVSYQNNSIFIVYSIYEYGDLDVDVEFDENSISWCTVFIKDSENNILIKLIDDETA